VNDHWQKIQGWFDFQSLYDAIAKSATNDDLLVEVGCYKGKSVCYLGAKLIELGKTTRIFAIDTFNGTENEPHDSGFLIEFQKNVELSGCQDIITPLPERSPDAAKNFMDNECALIFLDACHEYSAVKTDIAAWLPKVKPGGILAGHDYNPGPWPGVVRAVQESFKQFEIARPYSWVYRKET